LHAVRSHGQRKSGFPGPKERRTGRSLNGNDSTLRRRKIGHQPYHIPLRICKPRKLLIGRQRKRAHQLFPAGLLDPLQTEKLLRLTFHPVGSIVQLSDGSTALVVGTPKALAQAGKATVLPLRRADGQLPPPWPIDLGETPNLTIARALSPRERARLLGRAHPLLV